MVGKGEKQEWRAVGEDDWSFPVARGRVRSDAKQVTLAMALAAVAAALVLAAATLQCTGLVQASGAPDVATKPQIECVCTSTHFGDVSFSVKCKRDKAQATNAFHQIVFPEKNPVSCEKGTRNGHPVSGVGCSPPTTSTAGTGPPPEPDPSYRNVPGKGYYKFHRRLTTWDDALVTCAKEGATLTVLNSAPEVESLRYLFQENQNLHKDPRLNNLAWVGVTDLKSANNYLSLTGKTLNEEGYARWAVNEPNSQGGSAHCVAMNREGEFNVKNCNTNIAFICERPLNLT